MRIEISYPDWVDRLVDWDRVYGTVEDRMRLAIAVARENVERGTGGPFGAAVFADESGLTVSVGMNLVVTHSNSMLHAEVVALMMAEAKRRSYSLGHEGAPKHQLVASSDPCAMCLGATIWSGVGSLVTGAALDDARALGFDEGPVDSESYRAVEERGVEVVRGVLRVEAREVMALYRERGGEIYNG